MVDLTNPSLFHQLLVWPIVNLLILLYKGFTYLSIPGSFGWAIIGLTLIIRGAMHPLTHKQIESAKKMQSLKPQLEKLQKKYKKDKQKLSQEQMKLYQKHGINPAAGCLPLLIQMPIIYGLFQVFRGILLDTSLSHAVDVINTIVYAPFLSISTLDTSFFGINLALYPKDWKTQGIWLLTIPIITGILTWYQTKIMSQTQTLSGGKDSASNNLKKKKKKNKKKKESKEDMTAEMQKQMMYITPVMIGFFSYSFPIGLALYWNTYTLFAIFAQNQFNKKT